MIRVELGDEVSAGVFAFRVASHGLCGKSRQPLLDACRELERMGADTQSLAGLFREGREIADMTVKVGIGAKLTVSEPAKGGAPKFIKFQPFEKAFQEIGE